MRLKDVMMEQLVEPGLPPHLPPVMARWRPDRAEMAALERSSDAACVVFDLEGQDRYPSARDPTKWVTASQRILEECELRKRRSFTKREKEALRKQIQPHLAEARRKFRESGWGDVSSANLKEHASWVAQRLLSPGLPWRKIFGVEDPDGTRADLRACQKFARQAGLRLPTTRT